MKDGSDILIQIMIKIDFNRYITDLEFVQNRVWFGWCHYGALGWFHGDWKYWSIVQNSNRLLFFKLARQSPWLK